MGKVLFVATVVKTHINTFHIPFLKYFKDKGWQTNVCARNDFENPDECDIPYCDNYYDLPFERMPFKLENLKTFFKLKKVLKKEKYDIIHCHTPSGGVIARLAALFAGKKHTKVMYTAHGFHFYKGAPKKNWILYYPIEWICSFFTDVLITINKEDYEFAKKHMHAKKIEYVPGVGIDLDKFSVDSDFDKNKKKKELGLPEDCTMLLSVGELSTRKNQEVIIRALPLIKSDKVYYCIAGWGDKLDYLKELSKKQRVSDRVLFLGFRSDISELCNCTDIYCFPSLQEGLPVALMESMSVGVPCVVSKIRGNTDLIDDGKGGFLCTPDNVEEYAEKIGLLLKDRELMKKMSETNLENIKQYGLNSIVSAMADIYEA